MAVMANEQAGGGRETRWSANKKTDAVLRLLRGERLDELSRELRVEAHRLAACRDEFLAGGKDGLKGRVPTESSLSVEQRREAERKVGELTLDNDILRAAARKGGSRSRRRSGRGECRAAGAAGPGLPGAGHAKVDRALPHSPDRRHPPRTGWHGQRCGAGGADPRCPGRLAVRRCGLPQGPGPAAPRALRARVRQAGAPVDAGPGPAGTAADETTPGQAAPRTAPSFRRRPTCAGAPTAPWPGA